MIDHVPFCVTKFFKNQQVKKWYHIEKSIDTVNICTNLLGIVSILKFVISSTPNSHII